MICPCGGLKDVPKQEGFEIKQEKNDYDDVKQDTGLTKVWDSEEIKMEGEINIVTTNIEHESLLQAQRGKNELFCKTCKKTFFSKMTWTAHQNYGQCREKPYSCHHCDRSYCDIDILSMHKMIVHGNNCPTIKTYFYDKHDHRKPLLLESKKHSHAGSKHNHSKQKMLKYIRFSCAVSKHKLVYAKTAESLNFNVQKCFICNKVFDSKYNLNHHERYSLIHSYHVILQSFMPV